MEVKQKCLVSKRGKKITNQPLYNNGKMYQRQRILRFFAEEKGALDIS